MPATPTAQLVSELPEALWTEGVRRLKRVPALWRLAENDETRRAFVEHARSPRPARVSRAKDAALARQDGAGRAPNWRPGPLALVAYAVRHPECQGNAESWLLGAGREKLAAAYATISEDTEALDPLEEALPAALALRLRMTATSDWAALATDAVRAPDRWRLPLQYLWGLWPGSHAAFFAAFMAAGPVAAALAAQCLAVNLAADEIQEFVAQQNLQLPAGQWLAFTRALEDLGEHACARAILRPIAMATAASAAKSPPPAWNPLQLNITNELESSLLVAATEDYSVAHPVLAAAWTQLRQLRAIVAGHMGRLALKAGDLVVAQAGYQDAFAEMPDNTTYRAGLADVLVKLGRAEEAVVLLQGQSQAEAHLVAAQAHLAIGQVDRAREALAALESADTSQPHTLAAAAHMQADLGDPIAATRLMARAATEAGSDLTYFLTAAGWLLDRADAEGARAMAIEAAVLAPDSAEARETLGRALLACEQPHGALLHFEAALAAEPGRHTAAAGLARAALAAGQPERTAGAAQGLLDALARSEAKGVPNARLEGEAHTLLGQALSMQSQSEEAFTHFQRASTLVPSAPEPWRAMARHYLAQNDPAQALATLEAGRQALTLQKSAEGAPLLADLAERYVAGGRHAEAILALREACEVDAHGMAHHLRLGSLLRRQGSAADAVEVLKRALQLRPGDGATLYELAQSLENLGRVDEAWSALQQAALTRPAAAEPYLDLGRLTLAQLNKGVPTASPLQAIAALRGAIERAPDLAEAHGLLAQAQQLAGDAQGALESYQSALRLAPSRTDWSLGLGQVCLDLKRPAIAVAALQEALEHHPDHAPVYVALAQAHAACGLWRDSQLAAEAARRLDPDNPLVVQLVAKAAAARGEHQAALAAWREAVGLAPKDVSLQVSLARCLLDAGQADEARQVFAHALETTPGSAEAHLAAGQAYLQLAEVDQAFTVLSEAVQLAPHNAEVQATFAKVAAQAGNFEAAHAAYLQAADLADGPERADYLREAGEALWSINRRAAAVALWQRGVRAHGGDDHGLRARLGLALLELGQNEAALDMLETAAQAHHDPALLRESARAALAVGLLDRASAHLQAAIEQDPGDAEARYMFGVVRDRQSRPEAALQFYQQASRVNPHEGRYLAAAADAWAATGKQKEALEVMQQAVGLSPDSGEVQRRAGELFLRTGRTQAAIASFKQFVAAQPRDPSAHLALARSLVTAAEAGDREGRTSQKVVSGEALADLQQQAAEALQQAAALGGDPTLVRYWLGRGKAVAGDPREAQRLLESATLTAGANAAQPAADLFRALGIALRRDGQLDRARDALQTSLQHEGDPALGYLELGLTHAAEGDHQAAAAAYRRAIAAHPDLAEAHYQLGESLAALGEAGEAAGVIQRAIALRPGAAGWHYRLAKLHQAAAAHGDAEPLAAALGHFQRAAELEPDNATYCADLARALAHDGDLHAAAEQFRRATDANRQDAPLWTERGQTHLALGDLKTAAACFGRALELEPAQAAGLLGAARVSLAQGNLHDALNQAEASVRAAPEDPQALVTLADVNKARGDYAAAERSYTAASVKSPQPASALLALGRLYAMQQKWDRALTTLDRAAQADPGSDEILAALGEAQAAAGNPAAAMKTFREAARIAPRQTAHLLRLGRACRTLGQLDQALSHLMQAREMDPSDDGVLREIGLVFDQRRQFDRALEMYQLAIAAAPKSSANYTRAGVAYRNLKYYPEAVKALEHAVQLDSKNLEATKQLAVVSAMDLVQSKSAAAQI